jgi:hypothetical protein
MTQIKNSKLRPIMSVAMSLMQSLATSSPLHWLDVGRFLSRVVIISQKGVYNIYAELDDKELR